MANALGDIQIEYVMVCECILKYGLRREEWIWGFTVFILHKNSGRKQSSYTRIMGLMSWYRFLLMFKESFLFNCWIRWSMVKEVKKVGTPRIIFLHGKDFFNLLQHSNPIKWFLKLSKKFCRLVRFMINMIVQFIKRPINYNGLSVVKFSSRCCWNVILNLQWSYQTN